VTTTDRQFYVTKVGTQLTFRCSIRSGLYGWTVPPFLDGTTGKGRVAVGESLINGEFKLLATGNGDSRRSALQVVLFEELQGERTVTCGEIGNFVNNQAINITVLGKSTKQIDMVLHDRKI